MLLYFGCISHLKTSVLVASVIVACKTVLSTEAKKNSQTDKKERVRKTDSKRKKMKNRQKDRQWDRETNRTSEMDE